VISSKSYFACVTWIMLLTFLCNFAFVGAYVFVVGMIAAGFTSPPLPAWARGPILQWMLDIPQNTATDAYPNPGIITASAPAGNSSNNGSGGSPGTGSGGSGGAGGGAGSGGGTGLITFPQLGGPNLGIGAGWPNLSRHILPYPGSRLVPWTGYVDAGAGLPDGLPFKGEVKLWSTWYDKPPLGCTFEDSHYKSHTGQDFPVETGTPVYSTMPGQVAFAGRDGPYGNLVVVENGNYQVWFAHLEDNSFQVQAGQIVQSGDLLAYSDSTGNSTGPHVHYAVLYKDPDSGNYYWVDPRNFFSPDSITPWGCGG